MINNGHFAKNIQFEKYFHLFILLKFQKICKKNFKCCVLKGMCISLHTNQVSANLLCWVSFSFFRIITQALIVVIQRTNLKMF